MRRFGRPIALPMACLLLAGAGAAHAQGDPARGATVFKKCEACHAVDEAENKIGPHLVGIFGREAGGVEDFRYSAAMKDSGIVWTDETITAFLEAPKSYMPGNKMLFAGLKDDEIADLLAYLHQETGGWGTPPAAPCRSCFHERPRDLEGARTSLMAGADMQNG